MKGVATIRGSIAVKHPQGAECVENYSPEFGGHFDGTSGPEGLCREA